MEKEDESKPEKQDPFLKLPDDINFDIFSRLPLKTISKCKYVSKTWHGFIHHLRFAEFHYSRTKGTLPFAVFLTRYRRSFLIDPECVAIHETSVTAYDLELKEFRNNFTISDGSGWNCFEVVGTVNGLICFSPEKGDYEPAPYYICNPITRDYVMPPRSPKVDVAPLGSGFGFDSVNNAYKLVRILSKECTDWSDSDYGNNYGKCEDGTEVEIYTMGSGIWREIRTYVPHVTGMRSSNVFLHGCLHWAPYVLIESEFCPAILSLNMTSEEFNIIEMPPLGDKAGGLLRSFDLIALGGCLCIMDSFYNDKKVWMMKQYGVDSSWVLEYVFEHEIFHPLWLGCHEVVELKNGDLLLLNQNGVLSYYDRRNKVSKTISLHDLNGFTLHVEGLFFPIHLMGSLLSPKAIEKRC